jgi:LemA protein
MTRKTSWFAAALLALLLQGCGYNELQRGDEQIKAAWSEVLNQYQRRADLVPNLVATVKGFAEQEKEVLTRVTDARARAGQIQATPELVDANFRDLQAQLEGTENRIAVARNRYIKSVEGYNVTVRSFPTNLTALAFGHKPKPNFAVEDEKAIAAPPKVDFGTKK